MTEGSYRLAFVCACCLIAACSSTPGQKDSGFDPVEVPPARGMDASIADGRDGGDSAKTGQKDGTCAPDRVRERMKCGEACGQLAMGVPAVFAMVCQGGRCMVPSVPTVVGDPCRKPGDMCTVSFCDQPTNRTARCVSTLCPQGGTCCCQMGDNVAQRSCMSTTACKNDRMCVSQ